MKRHLDSKRGGSERGSINALKIRGDWNLSFLPQSEVFMCGELSRQPKSFNQQKPFTEAEDDLIIKLHSLLGNRWALIAGRLPDRTENELKTYWNLYLKKELPKNSKKMRTNLSLTQTLDQAQVSDACSGLEEDASVTRDLNLDLSMSMSCSSHLLNVKKKVQENTLLDHSPNIEIVGDIGDKTLLLFQ